ncbi:MAG: ABC transporter substrate-binding protein [Methanothrix sp.]|nr:ABC transporter substrate-binding protein [Methanothrix sp.]
MSVKSPILLGLLLSFALVFSGCISTSEDKHEKITTLRIGYQPSTHQIAEMVATDLGWWKDDLEPFGVKEVREFGFPSGPPEMQAMIAGELDIAYVGTSPPIAAMSQGLDARIVAAVNINGSDLVLGSDVPYLGPESLAKMKISTFPPGSIQDIILSKWLAENEINVSNLNITAMGPGDAISAIMSGKVDAAFLPHPSPAIIEMADKGRSEVASGEMWPGHACCSLVVSGNLIRNQPDLVEQIVKIHIKATEYVNTHPAEAARIYANHTGQDLKMVRYSIKTWDGKWISDPHLQIPSTLEYIQCYRQQNHEAQMLTEEDIFDTSFYDRAE